MMDWHAGTECSCEEMEGRVPRQIVLPRDGTRPLKQLFEAHGRELAQHQQHPRAAAQVQVQPRRVGVRPTAEDAPVLDAHVAQPQFFHLVAHELLQPQQARNQIISHCICTSFRFQNQYIGLCRKAQESAARKRENNSGIPAAYPL